VAVVHFCTVVGGRNVDLLPRLLRHYRYLGVNGRWLVHVHMSHPTDPILETVGTVLEEHDIEAATPIVGPWLHRVNPGVIQRARSLYPGDWCVIADHDEFQVYPAPLSEIVDFCEDRGYECVVGDFLDRVGENGTLPAVAERGSLWECFPLGGFVTRAILGEASPKVVLAKGNVVVGWGNHYAHRGIACPAGVLDVPVHHFKWDASVIERLADRCALYTEERETCADESLAFLEHLRREGRFDVDDPRLELRYVGNPYGDENPLD
jgi:hypothetical protein